MGDVLFALSIVGDLARHRPEVRVDWVVDESFVDLVACCSGVRRVWSLPFRALRKKFRLRAGISALKTLSEMRSERYDYVIDLQGMIKSGLVALIARGTEHWTYRRDLMAEPMLHRFFDHYFYSSKTIPALDNYRNISATIFGYQPVGRPNFMLQMVEDIRIGNDSCAMTLNSVKKPFIIVFPFASKLNKTIPADYVHSLLATLERSFRSYQIVMLSGTKEEYELTKEYTRTCSVRAMARLSLFDTMAFIANSRGFIGADTGLTHIAAAAGVPTVALFLSTNVTVFDPARWARQAVATYLADSGWKEIVVSVLSSPKPALRSPN